MKCLFRLSLLTLLTAAAAHSTGNRAFAAVIFSDDFNGPAGQLVGSSPSVGGNWTQTGTNSNNAIQIATGKISLTSTGQDAYAAFSNPVEMGNSNDLKVNFDLTISAAQPGGDYFLHVSDPVGSTTNFYQRLFARSFADGFELGLLESTGTNSFPTYGGQPLSFDTTYRVELLWVFGSASQNDYFSVSVNDSPYVARGWDSSDVRPERLSAINVRQGNGASVPAVSLDNLVVTRVDAPAQPHNIYKWEYVDPLDPSQGKRQSSLLTGDGVGLHARPGVVTFGGANLRQAYLAGADLTGGAFPSANLTDADLSHANLSETSLGAAKLTGADLTGAIIKGANFSSATYYGLSFAQLYSTASYQAKELKKTNFSFNNLTAVNFANQQLAEAKIEYTLLNDADLSQANLTNASFLHGSLTGANLTGAEIRGANFEWAHISAAQLATTASYRARDLAGTKFAANDLSGANFDGQNLANTGFRYATLAGASFAGSNLTDADLQDTNLSGLNFQDATLTRARLNNTNVSGANFAGADVRQANFAQTIGLTAAQLYSTASYAARDISGILLAVTNLPGVNLADQNLEQANFNAAQLPGTDFRRANLGKTSFLGATVSDADFTGADLSEANFGSANLVRSNLAGVNLNHLSFVNADLTETNFAGATIRGADFGRDSVVPHPGITPAQIYTTASYQNRDLRNIRFFHAQLSGGDFSDQNLSGAVFWGASIAGAIFEDADVSNADFAESGLAAAQLYATANYRSRDLNGIQLRRLNLSGWNFAGQKLANVNFEEATLTSANFANADIRGARFVRVQDHGIFQAAQLYSTANYQNKDLSGVILRSQYLQFVNLTDQNLTGVDFGLANLSGATLRRANLTNAIVSGGDVAGADFADATIHGANMSGISKEQLYTTASYKTRSLVGVKLVGIDLNGWDLSGQDLSHADLSGSTLSLANLTGAIIRGARILRISIGGSKDCGFCSPQVRGGIEIEQLMTTASYRECDLSGVDLSGNLLHTANFAGFNLTNSVFGGIGDQTNLTAADARGATAHFAPAILTNFIRPDGHIAGLNLASGQSLVVRDYDGNPASNIDSLPITIDQHLTIAPGGKLQMILEADAWGSTIAFAAGIPVELGGTLELKFADGTNLASQLGRTFNLFNWTGVAPTGAFQIETPYHWNLTNLYTTGEITLVPEPSALCLSVMVLVGIARCSQRRRQSISPNTSGSTSPTP